jgi:AraC-like DNA-binding protein
LVRDLQIRWQGCAAISRSLSIGDGRTEPAFPLDHRQERRGYAFPILPILCLILLMPLILYSNQSSRDTLGLEATKRRMPKRSEGVGETKVELARRELVSLIAANTPSAGEHATAIPGLVLFRRTAPTACFRAVYEPSLNIFAQGEKRVSLGDASYLCDGSSFLVSSIDVMAQSQVVEASKEVPLLSLLLRLEMPIVREILGSEELPESRFPAQRAGLALGKSTAGLLTACCRLIELLDTPEDIPFLSRLIQREIAYRILRTPQGERLRAIATTGDLSHRTAKAIAWLRSNYAKPLHMEELAEIARLGVSTLHHQFRALTSMSPLQYQKQLRLHAAKELMLTNGIDASTAAFEVGYESVSQFNREYGRLFGNPPMRDVKSMRMEKALPISAA